MIHKYVCQEMCGFEYVGRGRDCRVCPECGSDLEIDPNESLDVYDDEPLNVQAEINAAGE
jgi:hypothetical protein